MSEVFTLTPHFLHCARMVAWLCAARFLVGCGVSNQRLSERYVSFRDLSPALSHHHMQGTMRRNPQRAASTSAVRAVLQPPQSHVGGTCYVCLAFPLLLLQQ
jgi:hypothetical protein